MQRIATIEATRRITNICFRLCICEVSSVMAGRAHRCCFFSSAGREMMDSQQRWALQIEQQCHASRGCECSAHTGVQSKNRQ
jgi:hypothetical protein